MKKIFINGLTISFLILGLQAMSNFANCEEGTCTPECAGTGVGTAKPITCCPGKTYTCASRVTCCEKGRPGCYEKKQCKIGTGSCK